MSRLGHLMEIVRALPPTPLRGAGAPQLSSAIEAIIDRALPKQKGTDGALSPREEEAVEGLIRPIERIRAAEAAKEFPLSSRTLRPSHDPMYYSRMKEGVHLAARGQGRSWWKRFFQVRGEA